MCITSSIVYPVFGLPIMRLIIIPFSNTEIGNGFNITFENIVKHITFEKVCNIYSIIIKNK